MPTKDRMGNVLNVSTSSMFFVQTNQNGGAGGERQNGKCSEHVDLEHVFRASFRCCLISSDVGRQIGGGGGGVGWGGGDLKQNYCYYVSVLK